MKSIAIVGVGALGSHLVQFLRNVDASMKVIDFDRVEQKNVAAQFHSKPSVGKLKVQGLQQSMQFLFGAKIDVVSSKLTGVNRFELLRGADLIIDCLDNGASRRLVQEYAAEGRVPCLHGALAADGAFARVVWNENFVIDDEATVGAPTCEAGEHLPYVAIVAGYLARAVQEFLRSGKKIGFEVGPNHVLRT